MTQLTGILNVAEIAAERTFVQTIGQRAVFDAVTELLRRYNAELEKIKGTFVERSTSDHKFRYYLPGGGRLQRRGGAAQSGTVKAGGSWDVAFPLEEFGAALGGDDVSMAYMTVGQMSRHLDTIMIQDTNTIRFEIMKRLFNNVQTSWADEWKGTLLVEPLANGDTVLYPPAIGSETEATDDHYLESAYAAAAISDTNNPLVTLRNEIEEHFGESANGTNIACFIHDDQEAKIKALSDFDPVEDRFVRPGSNADTVSSVPTNVPGVVIGRCSGVWVVRWKWMPTGYIFGQHLDAPAPLIERIDPAETGLGQGLQLVYEDEEYPLRQSQWRHRTGFGAGNRLSAAVMELGVGGTYTIPTIYQ